jgi:glutamine synthetase
LIEKCFTFAQENNHPVNLHSYKIEYIWLDGYEPTQNLRSKTKVEEHENFKGTLKKLEWSLMDHLQNKPKAVPPDCGTRSYPDPTRINGYLVMTEVMHADGTPHSSNGRATIDDDGDFWFGFEQEYFIMDTKTLLPFPIGGYPAHKVCTTALLAEKIHTEEH